MAHFMMETVAWNGVSNPRTYFPSSSPNEEPINREILEFHSSEESSSVLLLVISAEYKESSLISGSESLLVVDEYNPIEFLDGS